jgi:hypothetical protein
VSKPARECWTIRFSVPIGPHSGRRFAAFLKALGRRWGIVAEQILEAPEERRKTMNTHNRPVLKLRKRLRKLAPLPSRRTS